MKRNHGKGKVQKGMKQPIIQRKPRHMSHGEGSGIAWVCMAANGTSLLLFIDDVRADRSSKMNSEFYRIILSAHNSPNVTKHMGVCLMLQMDDHTKYTEKAIEDFFKGKK